MISTLGRTLQDILPAQPPQDSASTSTGAGGQSGTFTLADFPIGSKVIVLSPTENWRPCIVVAHEDAEEEGGEESDAAIQVHYEMFDEDHDEWIGLESDASRIKAPAATGNAAPTRESSSAPPAEGEAPPAAPDG